MAIKKIKVGNTTYDVQDANAYVKPSGGIPKTDLASGVQDSLGAADTAYQKPSTGIPASDLASGVIPDVSGKEDASNKVAAFQNSPDDTHYPTEKLVKDNLDTINGQISILASGPEYNDGARCVVFPVSSSASYDSGTRCVVFPTLNV